MLRLGVAGVLAAVFAVTLIPPAAAQSDADLLAAREAFRLGQRAKLEALAPRLRDHELYGYVLFWQLRPRLDEAPAEEVRALLARLADGPLSDRLRNDWLASLGRRAAWELFQEEHPALVNEDPDVACYALRRRVGLGEAEALRASRSLWLAGRRAAETCNPVFEMAMQAGIIAEADIWARIRSALEQGQTTVAKRISGYLPSRDALDPKALDSASANPRAYVERFGAVPKTRASREMVLFALQRMARSNPQEAAQRFSAIAATFTPQEREYAWGQLGYLGALMHDPDASSWFAQGGRLTDLQLAWRVRAALRKLRWDEVATAIQAMSEAVRGEPEWRYWRARALSQQGRSAEANKLLAALAGEHNFYGLLAAEDLGERAGAPVESYTPTEHEIQAVARTPAIRRALAWYRLGQRFEGNREWLWAIAAYDDRQLLAGAEFARRNELWDRAINTAERTRSLHDFTLRYLAPYREHFRPYAREHGLDEAWLLGLVRQESRFIPDARSSAGAMGLMQLMPATARWVAGKLGLKGYQQAAVTDLDINISLGTYYLKHVLETLDNQPVLASAAYNAGPGRARAWRAAEPMESAIYAETIPFNETRDYVKKVMANATFYARILGQSPVSLKERIGSIPPRGFGGEAGR
jgi:soluble lytic murein transglycosylase